MTTPRQELTMVLDRHAMAVLAWQSTKDLLAYIESSLIPTGEGDVLHEYVNAALDQLGLAMDEAADDAEEQQVWTERWITSFQGIFDVFAGLPA